MPYNFPVSHRPRGNRIVLVMSPDPKRFMVQIFEHTLARVDIWNLAGFGGIDL